MGNKSSKHFTSHADRRPFVEVLVNGQKVLFMYDTGAQNSFIDSNTFRQLNLTEKNPEHQSKKLAGLVGKPEEFDILISDVDISILNKDLTFPFRICPFPRQTTILGIDFIHKFFLSYCVVNRIFEFKSSNPFD